MPRPKNRETVVAENQALTARILELEAENAKLATKAKTASAGKLTVKLGYQEDKDGKPTGRVNVRVYGLQRFPVTLYANQWLRLLDDEMVETILEFIEEHKEALTWDKNEVPSTTRKRRKAI